MRLLVAAGASGGGVYPALAVLQELDDDALELLWVGGEGGMEEELVSRAGHQITSLPAAGLHGVGLRALPGNLAEIWRGFWAARKLLKEFKPDVLIPPTNRDLEQLARRMPEFLEREFRNKPMDSGIQKFLSQPDHEAGDVKKKLIWTGTKSYLFRLSFKNYLKAKGQEVSIPTIDDFVCHNYSDFAVQESKESYRLCIEAVRRVKPDIILGHYWLEYFQHRSMARLACDSWLQAGWACSADLGKPWQAKALYHFEVLQSMPEPTHIVDVSDTFEYKLDAWSKFKTGQEHLGQEFEKMEARARFHGSKIGVKYAEALTKSNFIPESIKKPEVEL